MASRPDGIKSHAYRRGGETLIIPYRRPTVLAVYVRMVIKKTAEEDDEDDGR